MFCNACGKEMRPEDRFCPQCGKRAGAPVEPRPHPVLALDKRRKKIAGVCAGFARYFEVDVTLIRVIVLVLAFGTGIGFIAYPLAWIIMPSDQEPVPAPSTEPVRQIP